MCLTKPSHYTKKHSDVADSSQRLHTAMAILAPKKKRKRKITWFNPPFCQSIETNISKRFLSLVDKHFTPDHQLRKIFNRNTLKVSPTCMPNIGSAIKSHNNQLLKSDTADKRSCNCRRNDTCHVYGKYLEEGIIYEATIKSCSDEKKLCGSLRGHLQTEHWTAIYTHLRTAG